MNRINEIGDTPKGQKMLGRLQARNNWKQKGNTDRDIESYAKKHWIDNSGKRVYGGDLEKSYIDGNEKETNNIVKPLFKSVYDSIEKYKQRKNESKNMNKKLIKLTESDIHRIVKESVNRIIREGMIDGYDDGGELFNGAWENYWSQYDRRDPSINWQIYERYKGNPQMIKQWFEKYNIDYNNYF